MIRRPGSSSRTPRAGRTAGRRLAVRLYLFFALVPLLCLFPYVAAVNNPNENVRTYMTMALVEQGTLRIDDYLVHYGWIGDMARVPSKDGFHHYSVKAPAVSFAAVPVYWAFTKIGPALGIARPLDTSSHEVHVAWFRAATWALRLFVVQIPCAFFVVWFERYLRSVSSDAVLRLSAVTAACLGTNYVAYTNIFASHALCGVAGFIAFGLVERELRRSRGDPRARRPWIALLAGFLTGLTVVLEYHALPMAIALTVYAMCAFIRPRTSIPFVVGGLLDVATLMLFQWRAFGDPFTPGHKMVDNPAFAAQHAQGLFGVELPTKEALEALSFDPGFGFFGTSPYMFLGLLAIPFGLLLVRGGPLARKWRRGATLTWLVAMAGTWAVSAGFLHWRGGWTVGPRYLAAAPPFFAFGALCALEHVARTREGMRPILRGLAAGLAVASAVTIGAVGIVYDTLPESYTRPFVQFVVPMVRAGFVPHHVGEWIGWDSTAFWYVVAGCFVAAALMAIVLRDGDRLRPFLVRTGVALATFAAAMVPALTKPPPEAGPPPDNRGLMNAWEPAGRDRIALARVEAERRGPRGPCYWYRLADIERSVDLVTEANRDEARAKAPRTACPRRWTF